MLSLRNINPMVRAIGTMGAVAAIVTGVTFAATNQTTAVTLTGTSLTTATPDLTITAGENGEPGCSNGAPTTDGWTVTGKDGQPVLTPGGTSKPYYFCLHNSGNAPMEISMNSFGLSGDPAAHVSLNVYCYNTGTRDGMSVGGKRLTVLENYSTTLDKSLAVGENDQCQVTATLDSGYTTQGQVLTFGLKFTGASLS